jgi:hypothetical protein
MRRILEKQRLTNDSTGLPGCAFPMQRAMVAASFRHGITMLSSTGSVTRRI